MRALQPLDEAYGSWGNGLFPYWTPVGSLPDRDDVRHGQLRSEGHHGESVLAAGAANAKVFKQQERSRLETVSTLQYLPRRPPPFRLLALSHMIAQGVGCKSTDHPNSRALLRCVGRVSACLLLAAIHISLPCIDDTCTSKCTALRLCKRSLSMFLD
jgi:hypothetical protein